MSGTYHLSNHRGRGTRRRWGGGGGRSGATAERRLSVPMNRYGLSAGWADGPIKPAWPTGTSPVSADLRPVPCVAAAYPHHLIANMKLVSGADPHVAKESALAFTVTVAAC